MEISFIVIGASRVDMKKVVTLLERPRVYVYVKLNVSYITVIH